MRTFSFQLKIFLALALVTLVAALLPVFFSSNSLYEQRLDAAREQTLLQSRLYGLAVEHLDGLAQLEPVLASARENSLRLTIADAEGKVLADSDLTGERLHGLDNHADRPEIEQALSNGQGVSVRHSNSLGIDYIYAATRLGDNRVVRVAAPFSAVRESYAAQFSAFLRTIAWVILFCLLLSMFLASRIRRQILDMTEVVESISLGNYQDRLRIVPSREFVPLADAVNRMAENIQQQINASAAQQAQLETVLESLYEAVLVVDKQGNVLRCNRSFKKMFPKFSDPFGKQVIESIPLPGLQKMVEETIALPGAPAAASSNFELPDKRLIVAHVSRPAKSGGELGAVVVLYDATRLVRLEEVRKDFISNVSHELRTPLTAIASSAEILIDAPDIPADYRQFPQVIHRHATALSRLVADLLALSRLENGQERLKMETFSPGQALEAALGIVKQQLKEKGIGLDIQIAPEAAVTGNSGLISQVFANLLENAVRFSDAGSVITVRGQIKDGEAIFMVADQGPGVAEQERERIFERFYQIDKGRAGNGTGLGLAISKHIIEQHGGRIWVKSPYENYASAFFFSLPVTQQV